MKELNLKLSIEEINEILAALQERPFKTVHLLINKVSEQANSQLEETKKPNK